MLLLMIGMIFVGLYLSRISQELKLSRNQLDYQESCLLAARGLDYGVLELKDIVRQYQLSTNWTVAILQARLDAIPPPSDVGDFRYKTPDGTKTAFKIVADPGVSTGIITSGQCQGADGSFQHFTIACGCGRQGSKSAVIKQTLQVVGVQLIRFGVFYDPDLEIFPGANMDFFGPVHVNGNLYIGGDGVALNFHDRVTAHGNVYDYRKDSSLIPSNRVYRAASIKANTNGAEVLVSDFQGGKYIDSDYSDWMTAAISNWHGNLQSSAHGIQDLAPPIGQQDSTNNHVLIERPNVTNNPTGMQVLVSTNQYSQQTEDEKFANKAALTIYVNSNGTVQITDFYGSNITARFTNVIVAINGSNSGMALYSKTNNGNYMFSTNPPSPSNGVYDITQTNFWDARQQAYMTPVDVYVDKLLSNYPALYSGTTYSSSNRGVVYVTRDKLVGASNAAKQPCVRIRNGNNLTATSNGLSIVSDLPLYVEGNYNTNKIWSPSLLTTTNMPALLGGDAITLLSTNWNDAYSKLDDTTKRAANDTTYNTVLMTGCRNTIAATTNYNGGLENELRFLENWGGKTAIFRGSIIDLWFSKVATNNWYCPTGADGHYRYNPPNRNWGYDDIYRTQAPPGMTRVFGMEEVEWKRTTWTDPAIANIW
jgi:hypothetical protein